ncbi:hypothetical protein AB1E18_008339 [Capra hircus]
MVIQAGGSTDVADHQGATPVHLAVRHNVTVLQQVLMDATMIWTLLTMNQELWGTWAPHAAHLATQCGDNPTRALFKGLVAIGRRDLAGKCLLLVCFLLRAALGPSKALLQCSKALQGCSDHSAIALALNLPDCWS